MNKNKAKGTMFHSKLVVCIRDHGFKAEKIALAGSEDESDLWFEVGGEDYVFEVKATNKLDSAGFLRQGKEEAENYAKARDLPAVPYNGFIWKRPNQPISQALVGVTLSELLRIAAPPF